MIYLGIIIGVLLSVRHSIFLYGFCNNLKKLNQLKKRRFSIKKNRYIVLVPILKENASIIKGFIDHHLDALNKYDINIYFITTEKEGVGKNSTYNTTKLLLDELKSKSIHLIHSMSKHGFKGQQINFAIDSIKPDSDEIIGIYDIDSRPDLRVYKYLERELEEDCVYQQYSIYSNKLKSRSFYSKLGAHYQTIWSIFFEAGFSIRQKEKKKLKYLVGHGLFIQMATLEKLDFFESSAIAEDLLLGYKCSISNIKFQPIPYFDYSEFANNYQTFYLQSGRWFAGEFELFKKIKGYRWLKTKRALTLMIWPLEPIINIFLLIISFFDPFVFFLFLINLSLLIVLSFMTNKEIGFYKDHGLQNTLLIILFPLWTFLRGLGAINYLTIKIFGREYHYYKTEK